MGYLDYYKEVGNLYNGMGNPNNPQATPIYKNWLGHAKQDIGAGMGSAGLYDSNLGTRELASASGDMASNIWQRLYGMKMEALGMAKPVWFAPPGGGGMQVNVGPDNPYALPGYNALPQGTQGPGTQYQTPGGQNLGDYQSITYNPTNNTTQTTYY